MRWHSGHSKRQFRQCTIGRHAAFWPWAAAPWSSGRPAMRRRQRIGPECPCTGIDGRDVPYRIGPAQQITRHAVAPRRRGRRRGTFLPLLFPSPTCGSLCDCKRSRRNCATFWRNCAKVWETLQPGLWRCACTCAQT